MKFGKPIIIFLFGIIIYLFAIIGYFCYDFYFSIQSNIANIDNRLNDAAFATLEILGEDFHDNIFDKNSISREQYVAMTKKLSKYCFGANIKYVYTMIMLDNKIYITSTSVTKEELNNSSFGDFFEEYTDSTAQLIRSFSTEEKFYEEASDKWGNFRSVIIPQKTKDGRTYIVGADITIEAKNKIVKRSFINSLFTSLFFFVVVFPILYAYFIFMKNQKEELLQNLYIDRMTNLPNRNRLLEDMKIMQNPILMLLNINSFKEINDFYGHKVGDKVLKDIGERLKSIELRDEFFLYKMAADEYAILFKKKLKEHEIKSLARYYFEILGEEPFMYENNEISLNATIGIAMFEGDSNTNNEELGKLLINADMALKRAKEKKRHFILYEESMEITKEYENNIIWRKKLIEAIKNDRITVFFQPIINNKTEKVEKYESLIRMIDDNGKIISPYYFLEVSKKARLYHYLTRIIISKSFNMFENSNYEFSINLSVEDILDDTTYQFIIMKLRNYPKASNVVFEILESDGIENYDKVIDFIKLVKSYGAKIAIDDFGSGYSNFMHTLKLDVDYLKIDASMIKNIDTDKNSLLITETIVEFAKKFGIKTIAEFVHNLSVYKKVKELGVDYSQGYYLGEPGAEIQKY